MLKIDSFRDGYRFLSNFYLSPISYLDKEFISVEHAYQAGKFSHIYGIVMQFAGSNTELTCGQAKRLAVKYTNQGFRREDWFDVNLILMLNLLRQKFAYGDLREKLEATGDAELIEGNNWGVCNGQGANHLGKLLIQVREENRNDK